MTLIAHDTKTLIERHYIPEPLAASWRTQWTWRTRQTSERWFFEKCFCTRLSSSFPWVFCCWVGTVYNESLLYGVCQATRASCSPPPPPSSALSRRWVIRQSKIGFVYVLRLSSRQITPPAHCASECQTTYKECNSLYSAVDSSRPVQQRSMERFSTPLGCYSCGCHWREQNLHWLENFVVVDEILQKRRMNFVLIDEILQKSHLNFVLIDEILQKMTDEFCSIRWDTTKKCGWNL